MTKLLGGLITLIVLASLGPAVTSCTLATEGLFDANKEEASCGDICVEAAAGQAGDAGTDVEWPDVVEVPDVCCGPDGTAGAGGGGGTAGAGGEGGSAGEGGTAGAGGDGGSAGGSGTAGAGGSAGQGGTGGAPLTCNAGTPGTVDSVRGIGQMGFGLLIDFASAVDIYSPISPTPTQFTDKPLPAQAVIAGSYSLFVELKNNKDLVAKPWHEVDVDTLTGIQACTGTGINSQNCLTGVSLSFRCQYPPYLESVGCPVPAVAFTAQPADDSFTIQQVSGWHIVLVDLDCP